MKSKAISNKIISARLIKAFNRRRGVSFFDPKPNNTDNKSFSFDKLPLFAQALLRERYIKKVYKRKEAWGTMYGIQDEDGNYFELC
jgi:hypothetical protein